MESRDDACGGESGQHGMESHHEHMHIFLPCRPIERISGRRR